MNVTKEEISYIEDAIRKLTPTEVILHERKFIFEQIFKMTMVDGKVCNAGTDTKSMSKC